MRIATKLSLFNFKLFYSIIFILGLGLLAIYSISFDEAGFNNFKRQLLYVGIAVVLFFIVTKINYGIWEDYALIIYTFSLTLLVLVLFFGKEVNNTKGWFEIFNFNLQPAEFAKLALIILLAKYFARIKVNDKSFKHIIFSGIYCAIPVLLILRQPDFGSASVFVGIWFIMLLNWGVKKKHLISIISFGLIIAAIGWMFLISQRHKDLILTAFNPQRDPAGTGYHTIQSITAVGSGKFYGKGLGSGSQSHSNFLPEAHTDFIFAAIGEEMGFLGIIALMIGFFFLFQELYKTAKKSADNFGRFLTEGVMALLFIQLVVNAGMNIGLFPVIGLPLPLVSYGGSALLFYLIALGIIFNINSTSKESRGFIKAGDLDVGYQ